MSRRALGVALIAILTCAAMLLAGCGGDADEAPADDAGAVAEPANGTDAAPTAASFEAIPAEGPGEAEAASAVIAALPEVREILSAGGGTAPELTDAEPRLFAYIVGAVLDDQMTLLEVRASGSVHGLYAAQRAFDSGSLVWTPREQWPTALGEGRSDVERGAIASAREVMADAFDGTSIDVGVVGYRFVLVRGDAVLAGVEIDTEGGVMGVSSLPR